MQTFLLGIPYGTRTENGKPVQNGLGSFSSVDGRTPSEKKGEAWWRAGYAVGLGFTEIDPDVHLDDLAVQLG